MHHRTPIAQRHWLGMTPPRIQGLAATPRNGVVPAGSNREQGALAISVVFLPLGGLEKCRSPRLYWTLPIRTPPLQALRPASSQKSTCNLSRILTSFCSWPVHPREKNNQRICIFVSFLEEILVSLLGTGESCVAVIFIIPPHHLFLVSCFGAEKHSVCTMVYLRH